MLPFLKAYNNHQMIIQTRSIFKFGRSVLGRWMISMAWSGGRLKPHTPRSYRPWILIKTNKICQIREFGPEEAIRQNERYES